MKYCTYDIQQFPCHTEKQQANYLIPADGNVFILHRTELTSRESSRHNLCQDLPCLSTNMSIFFTCMLSDSTSSSQADFSLRERKGEKEAWDTLYVGVSSTKKVKCIVKHTVIVTNNLKHRTTSNRGTCV